MWKFAKGFLCAIIPSLVLLVLCIALFLWAENDQSDREKVYLPDPALRDGGPGGFNPRLVDDPSRLKRMGL